MIFNEAQFNTWLAAYLWPMVRISAMLVAIPLFSSRQIPARFRLFMMILITLLVAPTLPPQPQADVLSHTGFIILLQQILIGVMMGFILQMVFGALVFGGQVIAYSMGLGFASMVDPANGVQVPVVAQFYLILATLLFLIFNGHLLSIELIADSFDTMPVAMDGLSRNGLLEVVAWGSRLFTGGLLIALPIVGAMLMVNMGMGVVMRAAPQLNIFSIGFPITMLLGFALIWVTLPNAFSVFNELLDEAFQHLMSTLRVTG
ncbi:MAG: flagellar biosynthetic protein FliR [Candidatus Thiodiazotropha sp. (ex Lucina aurantia)]|uniref:Flagellar biosynthetic protein FliR n=2 Tax=Candidatus Thiodiazotropha TaxID=1913444 RepID=A0A7Z0VIU8_9GAMM|nr:flagellar biosynthetic protein FliR [Candidatus Thiodiazotropha endolucinida]MBT3011698.1 flagellar biosynthetic protein FliR [Candidatus Thiodiazotropha sp. (ex Lucina pensylvanica)]MBT3017731.1 flagellar biosynthetic protein FliR [Candidatus Thiodiazotropha taylori]MBT3040818.1 flagellar biosynthetic protein FliR [Candidatus Thiodiazotropha sp. (ex Codakia orbicularis)]MBV2103881.1 flagellar biosynthetic protein FliR [Candidatus Thiodiazotropha sp. (ex Lucina aurantia)]MBT3025024.1 flagel